MLSTTYRIDQMDSGNAIVGDYYGQYLEDCLDRASEFPPAMLEAMKHLAPFIQVHNDNPSELPGNNPGYFNDRIRMNESTLQAFTNFKRDFAEHMDEALLEAVDAIISLSRSQILGFRSSRLFNKSDKEKKIVKKLELLRDGLELYSECIAINTDQLLRLSLRGAISEDDFDSEIETMRDGLETIGSMCRNLLKGLSPLSVENSKSKLIVRHIDNLIKASFWDISQISHGKEPLNYVLGSVDGADVAVQNLSADAKAIERICALPSEPTDDCSDEEWDKWRTHARISTEVEVGREVDKEALLERLRKGGVKV
jgi:hypothetical protein